MCGRFQLGVPDDWVEDLGLTEAPAQPARYNIAPSQEIIVVRQQGGERRASLARWGLVPPWAPDPKIGNRLLNARCESLTTRPAFRDALVHRRCLIPAHGFYEWQGEGKAKRPWRVGRRDGRAFGFAGLWARWHGPQGPLESCTIVTAPANALVAPIHGRMPAIVSPGQYAQWLDPGASVQELLPLLRPYPEGELVAHPVSSRVNSPAVDDEACALPFEGEAQPAGPVQTSLW